MALFQWRRRTPLSFFAFKWMKQQQQQQQQPIRINRALPLYGEHLNCISRYHSQTSVPRSGVEIRLLLGHHSTSAEKLIYTRLRIGGSRPIVHKGKPYKRFRDGRPGDEKGSPSIVRKGKPYERFGDGKPGDEIGPRSIVRKSKPYKRFGDGRPGDEKGSPSIVRKSKPHERFGDGKPGDVKYKKAWQREMDEARNWSASGLDDKKLHSETVKRHYDLSDSDDDNDQEGKKQEFKIIFDKAEDIDGDCSDELRSVWSGSDDEKTLWSGSEDDLDDDTPTIAKPHEKSDRYIDEIFEFEDAPKLRTLSELIHGKSKKEELNPGRQARKLAMENALKKLKKGPDGRYINVDDVITDIDVLIGSFEEVINEPEYADLRAGGPKKINMQFFKDLQERMRSGNFQFTPEIKLKPKSRFVLRKKYLRAKSKERKRK